jgi:type VI secretion system protein ImpI
VQAAGLLRHSVAGLQQSLRTRSELKNELRLSLTTPQAPAATRSRRRWKPTRCSATCSAAPWRPAVCRAGGGPGLPRPPGAPGGHARRQPPGPAQHPGALRPRAAGAAIRASGRRGLFGSRWKPTCATTRPWWATKTGASAC